MRLPPFRYLKPGSAREAARMLADYPREEAMAVSGGTDLYPNMKRRQFEPKVTRGSPGPRRGPRDLIEEASALAYRPAKPLDNTDLTNAYRKKMAKV